MAWMKRTRLGAAILCAVCPVLLLPSIGQALCKAGEERGAQKRIEKKALKDALVAGDEVRGRIIDGPAARRGQPEITEHCRRHTDADLIREHEGCCVAIVKKVPPPLG